MFDLVNLFLLQVSVSQVLRDLYHIEYGHIRMSVAYLLSFPCIKLVKKAYDEKIFSYYGIDEVVWLTYALNVHNEIMYEIMT